MAGESSHDLWWKNAVIYCLDVEIFLDANGDGIGDFQGLTERVDYLAGLGVTCIWLMPFYPQRQPRRRLRHLRLLQGRPSPRRHRRVHGVHPYGPVARHQGHRRPRRQSHLGPAPLVPGGALRPGLAATGISTSGATSRRTRSPRSSSRASRPRTGHTTRWRSSTTSTTSTATSPT